MGCLKSNSAHLSGTQILKFLSKCWVERKIERRTFIYGDGLITTMYSRELSVIGWNFA